MSLLLLFQGEAAPAPVSPDSIFAIQRQFGIDTTARAFEGPAQDQNPEIPSTSRGFATVAKKNRFTLKSRS